MAVVGVSKFALVVPTLNEVGNIEPLVNRIQAALAPVGIDYELIFVDDDSQDGTQDAVRRLAEANSRIRLLVRKGQRGLAGAVIHGWNHTDGDLLGVIDADLQHPPETLPALLGAIAQGSDIAIASRYSTVTSLGNWSKIRQWISRFGTIASMPLQCSGVHVKDPLSGFFMVRRDAIDGLDLQPYGFKILLEILVKGRIHKATEVPFTFATRHAGKSKADMRVALHYFTLLGKLSRHAVFRTGPQQ